LKALPHYEDFGPRQLTPHLLIKSLARQAMANQDAEAKALQVLQLARCKVPFSTPT